MFFKDNCYFSSESPNSTYSIVRRDLSRAKTVKMGDFKYFDQNALNFDQNVKDFNQNV